MQSGVGRDQSVQVEYGAVFPQESTETDEVGTVGYRASYDLHPRVDGRSVATLVAAQDPKVGELPDLLPEGRVKYCVEWKIVIADCNAGLVDRNSPAEASTKGVAKIVH